MMISIMAQAVMVRGMNPVVVDEKDKKNLVENITRIVLLTPKASKSAPVATRKGVFEGQTSVFVSFKDCKDEISGKLLGVYADCLGAYMVTSWIQRSVVYFCIEWI